MSQPFLTLYTPTYKRPKALQKCMESVASQTLVKEIEHLIVPDYVGLGISGMYQRVPAIVDAVHGEYVHFLADDDVLAAPNVVEQVQRAAEQNGYPPMLLVKVLKDGMLWPRGIPWPPVEGSIDLGCFIARADVWKAHCHRYGHRYEGDFDFGHAVAASGHDAVMLDVLFLRGAVSHGAAESVEPGGWGVPV